LTGSSSASTGDYMPIARADVEKIAELARLELTAEETTSFTEQLSSILGYIDKLNELDTTDVAPLSHGSTAGDDTEYARRDDEVRPSLGQQVATKNAPDAEKGYFKVPKVIGG
jgi:aspartyl-tRNA(Asn)/glutamyl-tRNA(Gln) amidotransferase subunit C